jgi:hypothetical protein
MIERYAAATPRAASAIADILAAHGGTAGILPGVSEVVIGHRWEQDGEQAGGDVRPSQATAAAEPAGRATSSRIQLLAQLAWHARRRGPCRAAVPGGFPSVASVGAGWAGFLVTAECQARGADVSTAVQLCPPAWGGQSHAAASWLLVCELTKRQVKVSWDRLRYGHTDSDLLIDSSGPYPMTIAFRRGSGLARRTPALISGRRSIGNSVRGAAVLPRPARG